MDGYCERGPGISVDCREGNLSKEHGKGFGLLQYRVGNDASHKSVGNQALCVPLLLEQLV